MENLKLNALNREAGESTKKIINDGFVPAVLYGSHLKESKILKIKTADIKKIFAQAGESTLIDLAVEGENKERKIIIKDSQKHLTKDILIHIDFFEVDMNKEIYTSIPLSFIGESEAVKSFGGVLIKSINEIEIRCLPKDLVNHIDVDISSLKTFEDAITLKQINIPEGISLISESDTVVANVAPITEEKEEAPAPTATVEGEASAEKTGDKSENKTEIKEEAKKEAGKK